MIKQITVCDVCGKEKQAVNHWWLFTEPTDSISVMPWVEDFAPDYKHACGQECVVKAVNKFMQEQMSAVQDIGATCVKSSGN